MSVHVEEFGFDEGRRVRAFTIRTQTVIGPIAATIMEWGATLTRFYVPDAAGRATDIVLGYDTLAQYQQGKTYFGAIAGRYGNRIRQGRFTLDGKTWQLDQNEGLNHLHGGKDGFDRRIWTGEAIGENAVRFALLSPDGDAGYPGALALSVTYSVTNEGGLRIEFLGTTDAPTLCNPVQHSYWNLGGHASGHILDHELRFNADFYTPADSELLATGEIVAVTGTMHDFRIAKPVGNDGIADYDHNYVLRGELGQMKHCATAYCKRSGIGLELQTNEPGAQFYTGGYLGPHIIGKGGHSYCRHAGFTLETQKFPCAPQFAHFPSARLNPGGQYNQVMQFQFTNTSPPDALFG